MTTISLIGECVFIGILSVLCCIIALRIIDDKTKNKTDDKKKKQYMILSFVIGSVIHYIVKKTDLPSIYCKKVCYGPQCFYVCPAK